ncbi:MAG: energy transducer TonB [Deltaproteobacteria bacterium]|nr:energy transducer TonB [Deltaproteobacteria bacterium]
MEGVNLKKDLLFAVFLALTIHLCLAFARIPVDQPAYYIKTDRERPLAVSFVSTSRGATKKTAVTPLIEEKKQVIVKEEKATRRKPVKKEDILSKPAETNVQKQSETQSIHKTIEKTSPHAPSPGGNSIQKEMGASPAVPRYLENSPPVYPSIAKRKGYEGTVLLSVKILANGTVAELRVKKSSGYLILDRAALKAVQKWKFEIPFTMWVDVPVRFVLE